MALTLYDQHLAWQQRVSKEVNTASKVVRSISQFSGYDKKRSSSLDFKIKTSTSFKKKKENNEALGRALRMNLMLSNLGVYAEVRGKYARPAPQLNNVMKNPILQRPTTAGSLRPKSRAEAKQMTEEKPHIEARPQSSMSLTRPRSVKRSRKSVKSFHQIDPPIEVPKNPEFPKQLIENLLAEKPAENEEETVEILPDLEEEKEDKPVDEISTGKSSYRTTSTTRRYILELESLLKEEKLKRLKLEEMLQTVYQNN